MEHTVDFFYDFIYPKKNVDPSYITHPGQTYDWNKTDDCGVSQWCS